MQDFLLPIARRKLLLGIQQHGKVTRNAMLNVLEDIPNKS